MELMHAVVTQESAKISCNFEQIETAIKEKLSQYEGIVFEEGSKTYAKKDVAMLRAEKKTFQDNLREEKRKYMAPWEAFETRARALINMYDTPINLINGQLQAFEEKRIEEKRELIRQIYSETVPDSLRDYIPLKSIYSPKWENATVKEKAIRQEITAAAERVGSDISTIQEMQSEGEEEAVLGGRLLIRRYHNKGAFLNAGERRRGLVAVLSVALTLCVTVLFLLTFTCKGSRLLKAGLAFLLGGAYSNTYDRLMRKYVVDYVSFPVKNKKIRNIVFNISDFCIAVGALLMVLGSAG